MGKRKGKGESGRHEEGSTFLVAVDDGIFLSSLTTGFLSLGHFHIVKFSLLQANLSCGKASREHTSRAAMSNFSSFPGRHDDAPVVSHGIRTANGLKWPTIATVFLLFSVLVTCTNVFCSPRWATWCCSRYLQRPWRNTSTSISSGTLAIDVMGSSGSATRLGSVVTTNAIRGMKKPHHSTASTTPGHRIGIIGRSQSNTVRRLSELVPYFPRY